MAGNSPRMEFLQEEVMWLRYEKVLGRGFKPCLSQGLDFRAKGICEKTPLKLRSKRKGTSEQYGSCEAQASKM